ncbi:MAG: HAD hydrolase-like protein [Thermodesulfobacteriota bacterium]
MRSPVLLFDLDGTITDPQIGIVRCMRYALERLARACPPDKVLASFIGPPLRGTFSSLLETSDKELIEKAMALYRQRFADQGIYENQVYDGIPEMLETAHQAGSVSFIATSKPAVYAERIIKHFGLDGHFAKIYGSELDGRLENKADLLAFLLVRERIPAGAAIMVGDRAADILAAKANGIRSIGVLWGYGSEAELTGAGADKLCLTPAELGSCLSQIPI